MTFTAVLSVECSRCGETVDSGQVVTIDTIPALCPTCKQELLKKRKNRQTKLRPVTKSVEVAEDQVPVVGPPHLDLHVGGIPSDGEQ